MPKFDNTTVGPGCRQQALVEKAGRAPQVTALGSDGNWVHGETVRQLGRGSPDSHALVSP